ncbi:MAG: hypothetical protein RL223_2356, partial [Pseudomonadota bacterium]
MHTPETLPTRADDAALLVSRLADALRA